MLHQAGDRQKSTNIQLEGHFATPLAEESIKHVCSVGSIGELGACVVIGISEAIPTSKLVADFSVEAKVSVEASEVSFCLRLDFLG